MRSRTYDVHLAEPTTEAPLGQPTKSKLFNIAPPSDIPTHEAAIGATISPMNSVEFAVEERGGNTAPYVTE